MRPIFADNTYLVGYLDQRDQHHAAAVRFPLGTVPLVTSDLVLAEFLNTFSTGYKRVAASQAVRIWMAHPRVRVIYHDRSTFHEAVDFYERRPDQDWGLTDCASFLIMDRLGMDEALTADRHFQQAGYKALLLG